ncbi:PLP-dependent aminotransferase family protein [Agrobacterium tumefaciens]|uniref:PLP-dependent aminotransferase family protein n=1 Tax=Agrobacterium tumefaciens TaxID=358 RepID=A0A4D7YMX4_AGRTU|nr:PLP-dependent aminotransferase family protein [Agrobacterium tumefaciens]QCL97765.1 PLP-dependent aminotransferase family protein [Agrobacterium tumefaciens]
MAIWTPNIDNMAGTRARALVEAIRQDIAAGLLKPGDRLPPQRELAYALRLSPNTVMRAYAEATRRGYVAGAVGRGTYVRSPVEHASESMPPSLGRTDQGPVDFSLNLPFPGAGGDALAGTLASLVRGGGLCAYLDHQQGDASARHAQAGARWIAQSGFDASGDNLVLTNGSQQGIFVSLMSTLRPGEPLLSEALTYAPLKAMARQLGLRLVGVPMDPEGLLPDALEAACRQWSAKVLYCTPTLQTPTTATMGEDRRRRIARIAEACDLVIIEDDVFGALPPARPVPLAAFAPDRTILVTGLSKSVAPGLRVGFVHSPEKLVQAIRSAVAVSTWMPPPLMAEVASRWIEDGTAERLNQEQRAHAARRQAMARQILAGLDVTADPHGLHLWLSMPDWWTSDAFVAAAERGGVLVRPASAFQVSSSQASNAVRLCLSHEASDERFAHGLRIVAGLAKSVTPHDLTV